MQAVVWTDYGKIEVQDVPRPILAREEILVRVKAASLCKTDTTMIERGILGIAPPVIIGHEVAGVVAEIAPGVVGLEIGQLVALDPPVPCRRCRVCLAGFPHMCPHTRHIGAHTPGGMAEYVAIDYRNAYPVPAGLSPEAASMTEPFAVCLEALARGGGVAGKVVAIFGDGPFGLIMSRLAQLQGAQKTLLFGHHESRMAMVREAGVLTFDGRAVDVADCIRQHTEGYGAEVIVDTTGAAPILSGAVQWVMPRGTIVVFTSPGAPVALDLETVHFREITLAGACRSLGMFPEALRIMHQEAAWVQALVSLTIPIERVAEGFEWITQRKDQVIKAVMTFESAA
jgi:threonine dehydrogenase-like Zn-dependent dehydrogenase